jgi:lysozyme family protein
MSTRYLDLKDEYEDLWASVSIRQDRKSDIQAIVDRIILRQGKYAAVERDTGVPWKIVAAIHALESSLSFSGHLHNGDPLTSKTIHVPSGRPLSGEPPFTWEQSAIDALRMKITNEISTFSIPESLWYLERYNGFGYRGGGRNTTPPMRSPYLWSFTNHYSKGKYVKDGVFDPNAISRQAGAAAILFALHNEGIPGEAPQGDESPSTPILDHLLIQGTRGAEVAQLQMCLRDLGIDVGEIDGQFGPRTLTAVLTFQAQSGLVQDGVVGPQTWQALFNKLHATDTPSTTESLSSIRTRILNFASQEASKGRSHAPGNEIDQLVLDPLRPILVELGHLGRSQQDTFYNWCAAWVTYICRNSGISVPDRYANFWASAALVDSWRHMGRETGSWFRRGTRAPIPGDIVTFDWDGDQSLDHIGIFKEFGSQGSIITLEGNNKNCEGRFSRSMTLVDGFIDVDKLAAVIGAA